MWRVTNSSRFSACHKNPSPAGSRTRVMLLADVETETIGLQAQGLKILPTGHSRIVGVLGTIRADERDTQIQTHTDFHRE